MRLLLLVLLFTCISASAHADCTNPAYPEGKIFYSETEKLFQYCDGTNWIRMNLVPGSGSGGCNNPARGEGRIIYNADHRVMQACAGNVWRAMGPVGGGAGWTEVSSGGESGCGIQKDGTLWCWGSDEDDTLGDGPGAVDQHSPVQIPGSWKKVSHSCAIKADDTLWCWGNDDLGAVGNGPGVTPADSPSQIIGGGTWKDVAALSGVFGCGIKSDNTLWCWGWDNNYQLGDGDGNGSGSEHTPVSISGGGSWKKVSVGLYGGCGIKSDDTLWCWGTEQHGRLGNGGAVNENQDSPVQVSGGGSWIDVTTDAEFSCGIKSDNTLWCWGLDVNGELGNGSGVTADQANPYQVPGSWKKIKSHADTACGIKTDDTLWCWGWNIYGKAGQDWLIGVLVDPTEVEPGATWLDVDPGGLHSCAIKTSGGVFCWGDDAKGQRGNGVDTGGGNQLVPAPVENSAAVWSKISASTWDYTCGIKLDGTGWCWGVDYDGQLGNAADSHSAVPDALDLTGVSGTTWTSIATAAGGFSGGTTCGIRNDGTGWCWGGDTGGQLGNGGAGATDTPTAIDLTGVSGTAWTALATSGFHSCGIRNDGTGWCWGDDSMGQLGNGAGGAADAPAAIDLTGVSGTAWTAISTGGAHTCGIRDNGTAWCWGDDSFGGQLGNGAAGSADAPAAVDITGVSGTAWTAISAGAVHTCGIRNNGTAWCWGDDTNFSVGALGNGAGGDTQSPGAVDLTGVSGTAWTAISGNGLFTCGLRNNGTAWCWGNNDDGQLGNGTSGVVEESPVLVNAPSISWASISTGGVHTCGITSANKLLCWGEEGYELGIGVGGAGLLPWEPASTICGQPERLPGTLLYNSSSNVMQYCDGVSWVRVGK